MVTGRFLMVQALAALAVALTISPAATAQNVTSNAASLHRQIQNDSVAPTIAPAGADVTMVVFSDYQCPYCRKVHPALEQLRREDPKLRVVYRDWPVFGAVSREAARTAIAANYQGRHAAFNNALMQTQGRITSQSIRIAADRAGVDGRGCRLTSSSMTWRSTQHWHVPTATPVRSAWPARRRW